MLYGIDNDTLDQAFAAGLFVPVPRRRSVCGRLAVPARPAAPGHPDRQGRRVRRLRHRLVPLARHGPPDSARRPDRAPLQGPASSPRTRRTSTPGPGLPAGHDRGRAAPAARDGWQAYWKALRANGVDVADQLGHAFYSAFTGGGGKGTKPIVVSYATDPAYAVINADAPAGDLADRRDRQHVLPPDRVRRACWPGAKHPAAARALVDFLLSMPFQQDMPLQMYVQPVNPAAKVPAAVRQVHGPAGRHAAPVSRPGRRQPRHLGRPVDQPGDPLIPAADAVAPRAERRVGALPVRGAAGLPGASSSPGRWPPSSVAACTRATTGTWAWSVGCCATPSTGRWPGSPLWEATASTVVTLVVALPMAALFAGSTSRASGCCGPC